MDVLGGERRQVQRLAGRALGRDADFTRVFASQIRGDMLLADAYALPSIVQPQNVYTLDELPFIVDSSPVDGSAPIA